MAHAAFDPFDVLQVRRDASLHAIKSQYHKLVRRYHPNRHQGTEQEQAGLAYYFHRVNEAWRLLSNADTRRRCVEVLDLLDLQADVNVHHHDVRNELENPQQHPASDHAPSSDLDGYLSSDADDDLPHVGIQRRQTVLKRSGAQRGSRTRGQTLSAPAIGSDAAARRPSISSPEADRREKESGTDYFTIRRKKMKKLQKQEYKAFVGYRDAMLVKFEAEEEAESRRAAYEQAKWEREYLEREPRGTTERLKSFQRFMGAYRTLTGPAPQRDPRSSAAYSIMSPITGPSDSGQFLLPEHGLSRRKSVHKRAWSTDISGDQTSSDSDSDGPSYQRKASPPGQWHHHSMRRGRDSTSFVTFRQPNSGFLVNTPPGPREPPRSSAELKIVVRQATDLNGMAHQSSDRESFSRSSRSPSSNPVCPDLKFTLASSSRAAELFGISTEHRPRSPSPAGHRRSPSRDRGDQEAHNSADDLCRFLNKPMGLAQHQSVPLDRVHTLTPHEKERMLGAPPDSDIDPNVVMQRLRQLDTSVAEKYMVKPDIINEFNFRLVYNHREITKQQHQTFIALSYRRRLTVERHKHHYTLPLDHEIFQAVWDERQDDNEGVWIDQICIDQSSSIERTVSMSAMDLVYRSARMIVIALDDIELDSHEGDLLVNHMEEYASMSLVSPRQRFRGKSPPYLARHEDLYQVIRKMLTSSWFTRAWCRHEMRLAKQHIFLIPCKRPGSWSGRDVLRFNGKCIAHLLALSTEVPFEFKVENVKPALHAFFTDRSRMAAGETEMNLHHGNFSTVVAEVFAMETGGSPHVRSKAQQESDARKDKIAIILNTLECGLALTNEVRRPEVLLSENECYQDLLLVALAAQDPGSLCSVGRPLPVTRATNSWLFVPTVADSGLNNIKTLQRIPENAQFAVNTTGAEHYIQLDLKFLQSAWPRHDSDLVDLARNFIDVCQKRKFGRNRKRYLLADPDVIRLFGDMNEIYVETLACVLHCGPKWMSEVCQRYSMRGWKADLDGAYELLLALRNTMGKWPESAWGERAAGFVMDFVNFLVLRGLPRRQIEKPEPWKPVWVPTKPGGHVITFIPSNNKHIHSAVPTVLSHPDYVHLARLWIVEPKHIVDRDQIPEFDAVNSTSEWTLLGKSVVFSDEISIEQMHDIKGEYKAQQRVHGRRKG